jgi:hypothetical protein
MAGEGHGAGICFTLAESGFGKLTHLITDGPAIDEQRD